MLSPLHIHTSICYNELSIIDRKRHQVVSQNFEYDETFLLPSLNDISFNIAQSKFINQFLTIHDGRHISMNF